MKIAIWGMGVSGISALLAAAKDSSHTIYAINSGPIDSWPNIDTIKKAISLENCLSENEELLNQEFDQIILSPGIDRKSSLVAHFISQGVEVISEIEFAARQIDLPIVAITGTNGKTTTTTMISECLRLAGKKVFTGGNIGVPFCEILPHRENFDVVVLELSSFQLESLDTFRANVAILLNISESHMERYHSVSDYTKAKLNIFNNQDKSDLAIAPKEYLPANGIELEKIQGITLDGLKIIGEHHLYNLFCTEKVLEFFGISETKKIINSFLTNFAGVQYRLQYTGESSGIKFYNDAKSTNPNSTLTACHSLKGTDYSLIMGGKVRDQNTRVDITLKSISPQTIFAIGEARDLIYEQMHGNFMVRKFETLENVFEFLKKENVKGNIIFSPGFPSFDQYTNYLDRGEDFERLFQSYFS